MSDYITSFIRTYVPLVVGAIVAWLATRGVELDESVTAGLVAGLTGLISALYYALARIAERRWPKAGWLLGSPKTPSYTDKK